MPGVVDQHVDVLPGREDLLGEQIDAREIAQIERLHRHVGKIARRCPRRCRVTRADDHLRARRRQRLGGFQPEAGMATCDDRALAAQIDAGQHIRSSRARAEA